MVLPEIIGNKFMYFGYGSNMLAKRILIQNKSAVRKGFGKLNDYQFQFYSYSKTWKGAPATIVPKPNNCVMGSIWEIDVKHLCELDKQESVPDGVYIPLSLPIELSDGNSIICRVYCLKNLPQYDHQNGKEISEDRKPSLTYLKCIIAGAIETGLPNDYIEFLKSFHHNNNIVEDLENILDLKSITL